MDGLIYRLKWLKELGCYPSIYRRGDYWRAHVNASGNFWADESTPLKAIKAAIADWEKAGRPMDGMAATEKALRTSKK